MIKVKAYLDWIMIDGAAVVCYNMAMIDISAGCPAEGKMNMLIGSAGCPVSFECSELIAELKQDIHECGRNKLFAVWLRNYPDLGIEIAVNYDYIVSGHEISANEVNDNERVVLMSAECLLDRLIKQNDKIRVYDLEHPEQ